MTGESRWRPGLAPARAASREQDVDNFGPGLGDAVCPRHPSVSAASTCSRCGTFMCDACSEGGTQAMCPECRERTGLRAFPLHRANWNFGALWDYSWETFKREWLMLSLGTLCLMVLSFIAQAVAGILPMLGAAAGSQVLSGVLQVIATALQTVVQGVLGLGYMRMVFDVLQGQRADVGRLFTQLHKAGPYFVTTLLLAMMFLLPIAAVGGVVAGVVYALGGFQNEVVAFGVIGVAVVLAIVPLFYFGMPLYLLQPAMAFEETFSPTDIIRHCYTIARGERLSIFGVTMVGGLLGLAGVMACCVGIIPALALFQVLIGGLYLALRTEDEARY